MSRTLLIAPHADDESLFAAYLAQQHAAHVVVVYDEARENELRQATRWLGCTYQQFPVRKGAPPSDVHAWLLGVRAQREWERVIIPAVAVQGHEEHNLVGNACERVFSDLPSDHAGRGYRAVRIIRYLTYAPRGVRDRRGPESFPEQPEHVARKLAALSCYRSQIADPQSGPWFYSLLDMREWIA